MSQPNEVTIEAIEEWLLQQHTTLWGDWIVTETEGRRKAAIWLVGQINSLAKFLHERRFNEPQPAE